MNYNLLLIANNIYFKLLHVSLKSICAVCDMQKIEKIYIADLGLLPEYQDTIKKLSDKIEILTTNINIEGTKKVFSEDWINAVSKKTSVLQMLVNAGHTPIIMIDSDTLITEDFADVINPDYDIQICKRIKPYTRPDGLLLEYIASFVSINNPKGEQFLREWIKRLEERISLGMIPPHETPAMIETVKKNIELKIGFIDDKIVSCENNYFAGTTKIIHAKGRTKHDLISIFRFANIRKLPYKKITYLLDNKDKPLFTIIFILKKIFSFYFFKENIKTLIRQKLQIT